MPSDDDDKNDVMKRISTKTGGGPGPGKDDDDDDDDVVFKLAPFNPSSDQIQQKALGMLDLGKDDVLFDLGCGDGRLLCFAATNTLGLRCVGIEIDELYVSRAQERVKQSKLESRIDIRLEDATKIANASTTTTTTTTNVELDEEADNGKQKTMMTDLTLLADATALYLFILPKGIVKMMPILQSLKEKRVFEGKRFRVLSYMFKIHDWEPTLVDETAKGGCPVYYYDFGP